MKTIVMRLVFSFGVLGMLSGESAFAQSAKPAQVTEIKLSAKQGPWIIVGMNGNISALKEALSKKFEGGLKATEATAEQRLQIIQQFANRNIDQNTKLVAWGFDWELSVDGKVDEKGGTVWTNVLIGDECADMNRYPLVQREAEAASEKFLQAKLIELNKRLDAKTSESGF